MGDSMSTIINATTTNGVVIQPDNSGSLVLQTNSGTTAITIDTSQRAAFVAGTAAAPAITTTGDTNTGIFFPAADTIAFAEGGTEAMRLDSSGNVGIGTTTISPGYIGGYGSLTLTNAKSIAFNNASNTWNTTNTGGAITYFVDNNLYIDAKDSASNMIFRVNGSTERMRIDSSGNVQIGKTSNSTLSAGINLGSLPNFIASTASPSDGPYMQISNIAASVANGFRYISFRVGSSGNEAGSISTNGSSTVSYVTSSDYRLKENVKPMVGALDVISKLNPVTYTWKIDGSDGQGFIAHELQEVVPDAVTGKKDAVDEEGNIKPQGVDTSFLVATLTAAIQEQQTIINDLKARVETLEAK
jgi:hypothetical protein